MADIQIQNEIENNLRGLLQPVNEVVQQSTINLNKLLKPTSSSLCLFQILKTNQFVEMRQLSAILLRQKLGSHWIQLHKDHRAQIKSMILPQILSEPSILVKKSISELVISMSKLELSADTWPELFPFLVQLFQSNDPILIQITLHTIECILDNNTPITQHLAYIAEILKVTLSHEQLAVRSAAVKTSGSAISSSLPPSKKAQFLPLLNMMIENVKLFITNDMVSDVCAAFEIFIDLAETIKDSIVEYLQLICHLSFEMASANIDYAMKTSAVEFLDTIIKHKPGFFKKTNLLDKLLKVLYHNMTIDDEETDENIYSASGIAIRECGKKFKSKVVYTEALPLLDIYQQSQDPNVRKASLEIIKHLSYGCMETMKDDMDRVMSIVIRGLQDQSQVVRQYACVCIGVLSQNLHPNIYKYSKTIFPLIFESINTPDDDYVLRCCFALEQFLFNLENAVILPIMDSILTKLFALIQRPNPQVKEFSISVISALALATELEFAPYFDQVLKVIEPFFVDTNKEHSVLKANAFDCLATLVKTVPKDRFKPLVPQLMDLAYKEVNAKSGSEVTEACFSLYSHIFERFGEEVAQYCELIHPQLMEAAMSNEALKKHSNVHSIQGIENESKPNQTSEEKTEEELEDAASFSVYTPMMDVKVAAIHCLSVLATNLPKTYINFCSIIVPQIPALVKYFYPEVRDETLILLQSLVITINHNNPPQKPWTIGDFNNPLNENTKTLLDFSFDIYDQMLNYDDDKVIVARTFECIANTVKLLGPSSIAPYLENVGTNIIKCFNSGLYCQTVNAEDTPDMDDEDEQDDDEQDDENVDDEYIEDEDEEEDLRLVDLASEAIIQIATVSGPQFKVYLETSLPFLLKLTKQSVHHSMRSVVIGTIGETIKVLNCDFSSFFQKLFPLALKWIKEETDDMKQVTTYLLGILIQRCVCATPANYAQALQALSPLLLDNDPEIPPEVSDNTVGCLARIMCTNLSLVTNLDQVLTIYFSKLPLRKELTEVEPVVNSLILLINNKQDLTRPYLSKILSIFATDLAREKLDDKIKQSIVQFVRSLAEKHPSEIQQLISTLPEQQQVILHTNCRS
ncbi:importin 4 [Tieghemostelium lacteum]|uniref:Importin 4 n=1 Tax=Tieghemostelium lacteum TaxID=361077 RepID=A0A152A113_TIELA|nr:importin 4 [Tieghemostelium lacteum]|eukprot:KYQ99952.1 importin 4 [Tieghemostelium lacteum]